MTMETDSFVSKKIAQTGRGRSKLIPVLQAVQNEYGYVSEAAMEQVALGLNVSMAQVYGVVTFYAQFHTQPPGKHIIRVCCGTACHVQGTEQTLQKIKTLLNIEPNETTTDGEFTLQEVACLGCCGLAPVVMVDDTPLVKLTADRVSLEMINDVIEIQGELNNEP